MCVEKQTFVLDNMPSGFEFQTLFSFQHISELAAFKCCQKILSATTITLTSHLTDGLLSFYAGITLNP